MVRTNVNPKRELNMRYWMLFLVVCLRWSPLLSILNIEKNGSGAGIFTRFPFSLWKVIDARKGNLSCATFLFYTEWPNPLGPTNSHATAVHVKTFSTSTFKVLIWILATTTKICTKSSSIRAQAQRLWHFAFTSSYSLSKETLKGAV